MNKIDSEKINDLANGINIFEFIKEYQDPCERRGNLWVFHCNNNSDSTSSLVVNPEKNFYKCFSCGSGTNALSYLIKEQGMSFYQACKKICDYTGTHDIDIREKSETLKFFKHLNKKPSAATRKPERIYQNYEDYDKFSKEPSQMWINEGISAEVQKIYDIRTQPERNRILYPIYDKDGRYICSKARSTLSKEVLDKLGIPKYKYIGSPGYCDYFVGMKIAKPEIERTGEIIIFEGIKSCMLAYQYGFKNAVSAETCCLNKFQIDLLLKMYVKRVVIAFDQDKSKRDMIKNTSILQRFTNIYVVIDRKHLLHPKDSPVDRGKEVWEILYNDKESV